MSTDTALLTAVRPNSRRADGGWREFRRALPWIAPATLLITLVVFFPAGLMIYNSTREISRSGVDRGSAGIENYTELFSQAVLPGILLRTLVWVVVVLAATVIISLAIAQLLDKAFPGRRIVRMIVIIPWASSVVMTTMVVFYGLEPFIGIFNQFFVDVGLLDQPYGFTKNPVSAFVWSMVVAVFVSLPFTTYTILSGLQTVPSDVLEAAAMDGAGPVKTYFRIVLPQLRSAIAVSVLINIINVFNSLPILRVMTGAMPGNDADTIMTYIYKFLDAGKYDVASALSVVGFVIVLAIVAIYLKVVKPLGDQS